MHNFANGQIFFKILAVKTRQDSESIFGHFLILCMKRLTEEYLDRAFSPIKSHCRMAEWSVSVKLVYFMLMECHDHLNCFQSILILLLLAPLPIPKIPTGKNSIDFFCS